MKHSSTPRHGRSAFTIVEVLVVIALILILLSIVVVAVNGAMRSAQRTNTGALMNSIKQSLILFREDLGYLPPVLDHERNLAFEINGTTYFNGPNPISGSFQNELQQWWSVTSLAEYLVGYGDEDEDGHDGPGIRNPGPDGYWGAANTIPGLGGTAGTFQLRQAFLQNQQSQSYRQGRVFGSYLQLGDERLLGSIQGPPNADGSFNVVMPGEANYNASDPKVILDYWGEPLRYYRLPYPIGSLGRGYRAIRQSDGTTMQPPTLSDFILLRPWNLGRSDLDGRFADSAGDNSTTLQLQTGEFGIFSGGPSRRFDATRRIDPDEFNRDNLVEVGP